MFNSVLKNELFSFMSNPPLSDSPSIEPLEVDGKVVNKLVYHPRDNKPYLDGVHFDANVHSLRARLNLGVNLQPVSIGVTENDPTVLQRNAVAFEAEIESKLNSISSDDNSQS